MRVAVVGAGIAGLTVAAALSRAGIRAEVYEQADQLGEVGAGIQISPNATRLLHRLGLAERLRAVAVRPEALEMRRWDDNRALMRTVLGDQCEEMFDVPYYTVHRADLHSALLGRLDRRAVHLDHRCVEVDEGDDEVRLRFANGSTTTADVVVGADGIHSVIREMLVSDTARYSGQSVFRGLVPADRVESLARDPKVRIWLGPGQHFVCYPISGGRSVSFVATTPAEDWRTESWTTEGRVEDLLTAYAGWNDETRQVISAADRVTRWALHDREAVARWSSHRVTVAGDAAHPMLPFGAQGAAQGIEDAVALARCLISATPVSVPEALRRYGEIRTSRIATVGEFIRRNTRNHHYSDGPEQEQRDRAMDENWGLRGQGWLFGYDAEHAVSEEPALVTTP
jgi:salicylate hydroxylase